MSKARSAGITMTDAECGRAGARDLRLTAIVAWQETARMLGLGKDRRLCGIPLGTRREYEARKGVYNPVHPAVSSCGDSVCPRCGLEVGLRRWALMVLAQADWVRQGGYVVFVSVAPRHHRRETVEAKLARLRFVTDWLPGKGETSPGRRWMAANGVESYVRVVEPTLGGINGVNVGAHYLFFCTPLDGEGAEVTAEMLGVRLQQALGDWVGDRLLAGVGDVEGLADEWGHYLADQAFHSRLAGVEEAARYMVKLMDGPGVAGSASELTDPTGAKRGKRNISLRAFSLVIAEETVRLGYRQPRSAIRQSEWLRGLIDQFGDVRRALSSSGRNAAGGRWRSTHLFSRSKGLFTRWEGLDTGELVSAALAVVAEQDPTASVEVAQLVATDDEDDEEHDQGVEQVGYDRASQAFHKGQAEDGSVDHGDEEWFRTVALDDDVACTWRMRDALDGQTWSTDAAVCHLLDQRGAWGGVVALRDAVRAATGERLYLHGHGQPRPPVVAQGPIGHRPKLLLTNQPDVPGWEPLDWEQAEANARGMPWRRRMTKIERVKARAA